MTGKSETETPRRWPDLAGRLEGQGRERRHVLPVRVYYEDTDFSDPPLL